MTAVEALKLNGKGERTQEAYVRHVRKLIEFHDGKDPDRITEDELKKYFIHRQDVNKWQPNTMRCCPVTTKDKHRFSGSHLF
ncbi:MAG: phage integrase N-terminal SAM-like domain-containing protein [Pseudomonadota bacterium]|nr:phage integrase N-terminal SAM-like domain-containing protein [Pseudomonadota bacterium]